MDKYMFDDFVKKTKGLKKEEYTQDTWDVFESAMSTGSNAKSEEEYEIPVRAFLDLRSKPEKKYLKSFIDKVEALDESKYTEESWAKLAEPLSNAKEVYADENAVQEEVDEAYEALVSAYLDLRLIPNKDLI